jgi:hypothetical protein
MASEVAGFYRLLITGVLIVWLATMGIIVTGMSIRTMYHNFLLLIERINSDK